MDLSKLDTVAAANEGFELQLKHPTDGTPLSIYITILGSDSNEYREHYAAANRARMAKLRKHVRGHVSMEEVEADAIDILSRITKGWRDGDSKELTVGSGPKWVFSIESAKALYIRFPWIREQVDLGVTDRANFIKG